ncbi:hypothetical protein OV450_0073 [Actinobacteria bacterium OV450]|nr:hypothetical protein OV450_0073 [Actinobacteria bacterium OV450]
MRHDQAVRRPGLSGPLSVQLSEYVPDSEYGPGRQVRPGHPSGFGAALRRDAHRARRKGRAHPATCGCSSRTSPADTRGGGPGRLGPPRVDADRLRQGRPGRLRGDRGRTRRPAREPAVHRSRPCGPTHPRHARTGRPSRPAPASAAFDAPRERGAGPGGGSLVRPRPPGRRRGARGDPRGVTGEGECQARRASADRWPAAQGLRGTLGRPAAPQRRRSENKGCAGNATFEARCSWAIRSPR